MNRLTVGMATYGDPCGAYFTITGLRANHPAVDLIVVDNAPLPDTRTRDACVANGGRYFHKPNLHGTSAPRDEVFRLSQTPWTACVDSHVIFETDAIAALIRYAEEHPESNDIVQGPLIQDNGEGWTHWRDTHPPALWGVWMDAWMHPTGVPFDVLPTAPEGPGRAAACAPIMPGGQLPLGLPENLLWDRRHEMLRGRGCVPAVEQSAAFEIPAMGLGVWAMRTAAWPGFNPLFAGFGGEEGYIHEVVRRRGGKAICLPALRWRHWFRDGKVAAPYPHFYEHQAWNYLVGHRELGIDAVEQIRRHPDTGARMAQDHFDSMARGAAACQPWNTPGERPKPLRILGVWYSNNAAPPKVLKASLDSIKRAADLSRADVSVVTCPWESVPGNPFAEVLAKYKNGPGHLNIVRQQKQCIQEQWDAADLVAWEPPDVVCFLEHDVLYPPDYFDRVARAFRENPAAPVVSNLDYEGLNATGWLQVKDRHEPLHQLSMRYDVAVANLDRCEKEAVATGSCLLEPSSVHAPRVFPGYAEVEPGLWIGEQPDEPPPGVTAVLNLTEAPDRYHGAAHLVCEHRPTSDDHTRPAPSMEWLNERVAWVAEQRAAGRSVFIHCLGGVSRSGMVTVAYLMSSRGYSREDALRAIRHARPQVAPRTAFWALLENYQNTLPPRVPYMGPQGDRSNWARIQPRGLMPAVHINHERRLTSHGEVVFHAHSNGRTVHPFWGPASDYWAGPEGVQPTVTIPAGCSTCGGQPAPMAPPHFDSLAAWYDDAQVRPSDFYQHVRTLKEIADGCESVAEISLWDDKPATVALAASSAKRVVSVRAIAKRIWGPIQRLRPDFVASTDDGPVRDGVDLLFWDENHRTQELYDSLVKYAPHVRRYLVVHCTTDPYGETGDDGGPGVMPGVRRFLSEHRQWTAILHDKRNHGLIVLSRDDRDKKQPPGLIRQAMNFAKALAVHAKDGNRLVNDRVFELRMAECLTCPERVGDQCAACGCPVDAKASWASEDCGLVKKGEAPKWRSTVAAEDLE